MSKGEEKVGGADKARTRSRALTPLRARLAEITMRDAASGRVPPRGDQIVRAGGSRSTARNPKRNGLPVEASYRDAAALQIGGTDDIRSLVPRSVSEILKAYNDPHTAPAQKAAIAGGVLRLANEVGALDRDPAGHTEAELLRAAQTIGRIMEIGLRAAAYSMDIAAARARLGRACAVARALYGSTHPDADLRWKRPPRRPTPPAARPVHRTSDDPRRVIEVEAEP